MSTNVYTSMVILRKPNWIANAALNEHGIITTPDLSFSAVSPALAALRRGVIKQSPHFVFIDEAAAMRAQKSVAHLTHALIELGSKVVVVAHDEGGIGQLGRISLNHGTESVLDTNLGAYLERKVESL